MKMVLYTGQDTSFQHQSECVIDKQDTWVDKLITTVMQMLEIDILGNWFLVLEMSYSQWVLLALKVLL